MLNIIYVIFLCGSLFLTGARRFAVLDFGCPILLTDIYIPSCLELASLSVDVWNQGEEQDGRRLAVALDGTKDFVMNDLLPPAVCRYLKVRDWSLFSLFQEKREHKIPFIKELKLGGLRSNHILTSYQGQRQGKSLGRGEAKEPWGSKGRAHWWWLVCEAPWSWSLFSVKKRDRSPSRARISSLKMTKKLILISLMHENTPYFLIFPFLKSLGEQDLVWVWLVVS